MPLAYFLTFRTYGTWLHGDARGSVDPRHNAFGSPVIAPSRTLQSRDRRNLSRPPVVFDDHQRREVDRSIRGVCTFKKWDVLALNVRSNHVHLVVAAAEEPERLMNTLKSWSTRHLVEAGLWIAKTKPWARHGSTRYLWTPEQVAKEVHYTLYEQ